MRLRSWWGGTAALLALLVVMVASPNVAHATDYYVDPLTSSTFAGRGSKGGTFSTSGWTTVDEPDSIWYEVADALPTGSIEYTVTGFSVGGTLCGTDHDILTMYQAPTGTTEPIAYSPYFRNNDFKAFTRIFGSLEPGRGGAMKLELAFCPRGDPWYHDTACPSGCDGSGLAYAHGTDKDVGWDPTKAYRMVLAWGSGKFSFSRDGEELGVVTYAGTYAPQPLRIRFGSPRHDGVYPGFAFMPKGLVFKDVKISGTKGVRTPVCGSTVPDAGPEDTGVTDSGGSTTEIPAIQDVTGASWETGVFPDVNDLNVEATSTGAPGAIVYLKFPAFPVIPKKAILRMHTATGGSSAGGSGEPCLTDDGWTETTLTWSTKPAPSTNCAGGSRSVDADSDVEWDVTGLLALGGTGNRNFAIVSKDPNGAHYLSKEASSTKSPRLIVVPGDPVGDAGPDSGTDATIGDSGSPLDSGGSDAKGPQNDLEGGDLSGGCGCRTGARGDATFAISWSIAALAIVVGTRRGRTVR